MQTSPQPHTRNTENPNTPNRHETRILPEENWKTISASSVRWREQYHALHCMVWALDTPVQHLVSAPQRAISHNASPQRVWWARRRLANCRLMAPLIFVSSSHSRHPQVLVSQLTQLSMTVFLGRSGPDLNVELKQPRRYSNLIASKC
jgi:hypothetical protein